MPAKIKPIPEMNADMIRMFWARVRQGSEDECWPILSERGVPRTSYGNYMGVRANRLALYLTTGIDPLDKYACHHCDNPPCCNPKHLYHGTPKENTRDARVRGRGVGRRPLPPEQRRNKFLLCRVTSDMLAEFKDAAKRDGKVFAKWAREILLKKAGVEDPE